MADILQAAQQQINNAASLVPSASAPASDPPTGNKPSGLGGPTPLVGSAIGAPEPPPLASPEPKKQNDAPSPPSSGMADGSFASQPEVMQSPPLPIPPPEPEPTPLVDAAKSAKPKAGDTIIDAPIAKPQFSGIDTRLGGGAPMSAIPPSTAQSSSDYVPSQAVSNLSISSSSPLVPGPADIPGSPPTPLVVPPPKKSGGKGIFIAIILLLAAAIPVGVYYVSLQNQKVAEIRTKAAICCQAGVCANGVHYDDDPADGVHESCDARTADFCSDKGGPGTGGGACGGSGGGTCTGGAEVGSTRCNPQFSDKVFTCRNPNGNPAAPSSDGYDSNNMWERQACPGGQSCQGTSCQPYTGGGNCSQITWCATFDCPNGDTNGDGQCRADPPEIADRGATWFTQDGGNCPNPASNCGQVDLYGGGTRGVDWGNYCSHGFINFSNCSSPPPNDTPTPTLALPPPECNDGAIFKVYDVNGANITTVQGTQRVLTRSLQKGETVILATNKAQSADHARFRLQGVTACAGTEWCNSDPADNTAAEFRRRITVPANYGRQSGVFEADLCDASNSCQ